MFTLTFQQNDQLIETLLKEYEVFAVFQENYRFKIDSDSFQFITDPLPDISLDMKHYLALEVQGQLVVQSKIEL